LRGYVDELSEMARSKEVVLAAIPGKSQPEVLIIAIFLEEFRSSPVVLRIIIGRAVEA
jgi:hypothetical protein